MTTRRNFLTLVGGGAALTLAGCGPSVLPVAPVAGQNPPDILLVDTESGLSVVRGNAVQGYGAAVLTPDAATLYAARPAPDSTELRGISVRTGQVTSSVRLAGSWVPSVAGANPGVVALTAPGPARDRTGLLITGAGEPVRLDLAGNYVPDAFSSDGRGLFVLDWRPAANPDHYRVREIDLTTKAPTALFTRDKQVVVNEEDMAGQRRGAVFGPGPEVLYTLYTQQPGTVDHRWDAAFIHTLQLGQHWAYCIDLPEPFGLGPNAGHALALAPDGQGLYVADTGSGRLAAIDTESLTVSRGVDLPKLAGKATFAAVNEDVIFVGAGTRIQVVDRASLGLLATRTLPAEVRGLALGTAGQLYVGQPGAVSWYDAPRWYDVAARSGPAAIPVRALGSVAVPGLSTLRAATPSP
jgi:DNA-binding beta-propeller fold protein YncE